MTELVPIGRFAQLTELTVRALRFYDELGLLRPEHVDDHSGYRYYATAQLERAGLIARLRRTAMSLDEVRTFLDCPNDHRKQLLDDHRARLLERAAANTDAMRVLKGLGGQVGEPAVHATPIVGRTLWDQPVLCIRAEWTEDDVRDHSFIHDTADGVGVVLPTCDLVADKGHIEDVLAAAERQDLATVGAPYFTCSEQDDDGIWRSEVGWPVERPGKSDGRVEAATLPGGDVVSTLYTGRFEDIAFAYRHLWTQIAAAGFTPVGNPREIYVTPLDGRAPQNYCTEVLWPISRERSVATGPRRPAGDR